MRVKVRQEGRGRERGQGEKERGRKGERKKGRRREGRREGGRERNRENILLTCSISNLQMATMAGSDPSQSQEPNASFRSPIGA